MSIDWGKRLRLPTRSGLVCTCGHYDGEHVAVVVVSDFTDLDCCIVSDCPCERFEELRPPTRLQTEAKRVLSSLHIGKMPDITHEVVYGIEHVHECGLNDCSQQAVAQYRAFGHSLFSFLCSEHARFVAKKAGCMVVHP